MPPPAPMLAKPGPSPTGVGRWFEPKWDGFTAIIRADQCWVRSRHSWPMTELRPEFAMLDGELVAFEVE